MYCNIDSSPQVVPDPVWLWLQFISLPGAEQDTPDTRQVMVFTAGSAQALRPSIPNEGSHTVALPCSPAPSCSPTSLPRQLHSKDCALCPVFVCNNHEKMYIYFLYMLSSSQGTADRDFWTALYWKGWRGTAGFSQACELPSKSSTSKWKRQVRPHQPTASRPPWGGRDLPPWSGRGYLRVLVLEEGSTFTLLGVGSSFILIWTEYM